MAVLVTLLAVVLALVVVLVAGLLRSHAEILRSLHELGVDLDPDGPAALPVPPTGLTVPRPRAESRPAVDVVGVTVDGNAAGIAVVGTGRPTLLAFLTTGCTTCAQFWTAFADRRAANPPGDARLVVVTKGVEAESPARLRRFAPPDVPVVLSSDAWDAYDVPVAPYFVYVDGESATVVGEGAANTWEHLVQMMEQALIEAGMPVGRGPRRPRARSRGLPVRVTSTARSSAPGSSPATRACTRGSRPTCTRRGADPAMAEVQAFGITVSPPSGWETRIFRRPRDGEPFYANAEGATAPRGEETFPVVHIATIPLPVAAADYGSDVVELLGRADALIVLKEFSAADAATPLFAGTGMPSRLSARDFGPATLQRRVADQCGYQAFFHEGGRGWCLYVVLGSFVGRDGVLPAVNRALTGITITPVASPEPTTRNPTAPTTTTRPPASTTTTRPPASTTTTTTTTTGG